jgi:hypothetical protein
MFSPKMLFREVYEVLPGKTRDFVSHYKATYAPALARHGLTLIALWQTSAIEGRDSGFIALWDMPKDAVAIQARLSKAFDSLTEGDPQLQAARDDLSVLVVRREGWSLLGVGAAMGLAEIKSAGLSLRTCLWTEIDVLPNQHVLYDRAVRANLLRLLAGSGLRLVGVYRPQIFSIEAIALWDLEHGAEDLAWYDQIAHQPEFLHWNTLAQASRSAWRARILEAA